MSEPEDFHVEVTEAGPVVRARLVGSLDGETVPALLGVVEPLLDGAEGLVLDCGPLAFCDSSGLRGFVLLRNRLAAPDTFRLEDPSPGLRQILVITGLEALVADPT